MRDDCGLELGSFVQTNSWLDDIAPLMQHIHNRVNGLFVMLMMMMKVIGRRKGEHEKLPFL